MTQLSILDSRSSIFNLRSSILDLRSSKKLAFRELEALTRALLTVLLTLFGAGVAREQSGPLELLAQLGVEFEQRARDAVTYLASRSRAEISFNPPGQPV